jgi:hypothetical protein
VSFHSALSWLYPNPHRRGFCAVRYIPSGGIGPRLALSLGTVPTMNRCSARLGPLPISNGRAITGLGAKATIRGRIRGETERYHISVMSN